MVEQAPGDADEGISRQLIHLARFLGVLMISWALLYALWFAFPELRRDAEFAEAHKREGLRSRQIFAGDRPFRVAVFGNSRLLAFSRSALIGSAAVSSSRLIWRTRSIIAPSSRTLSSFSLRRIHRLTCS